MARSPSRGDLFITVGGNIEPLRSSMKAGKSVINEFGLSAIDISKEVDRAFANMAANAPAEAKKLEQAFTRTFNEIKRNAQAVLASPTQGGAIEVLNANGARQAAEAAEAEAAALRQLADAAIRADKAAGGTNAGVRLLAVSSETAAREATEHAAALRNQANALDLVQAELDQTVVKQNRHGTAMRGNGIVAVQASQQVQDFFIQVGAGQSILTAGAQQLSQLAFVMQNAGGGASTFARIMAGPWGAATLGAVSILALLIPKILDTEDATSKLIDRMREQAKEARDQEAANAIWKRSVEGVTEAIRKQNEERGKATQTPRSALQKSLQEARDSETTATRLQAKLLERRKEVVAAIEDTRKRIEELRGIGGRAGQELLSAATNQLAQQEKRLANIDLLLKQKVKDIKDAGANARSFEAQISKLDVEGKFDPAVKATQDLEKAEADLLAQRTAGLITLDEYNKRLEAAKKAYKEASDAAKELNRSSSNRQSGRQVDFDQAAAIARAAGLQVNSAFRTNGQQAALFNDPKVNRPGNPVAPPGSSAHNGAQGKWALDIQITDGVTPAKIRKIFAEQGVSLTKVLKEKGHFHVEGSRSEAASAEREEDRAARKLVEQQNNFEEERARLKEQLLRSEGEQLTSAQAQAEAGFKRIDAEEERAKLAIQNNLEEGKYGEATSELAKARAEELTKIVEGIAVQDTLNLTLREQLRLLEEADEDAAQLAGFKIDQKQYEESIARTTEERRTLAQEILDLVYEEKKRHLEYLKAQAELAGETERAARIQKEINDLPRQKANDEDRADRENRSPLEEYFDDLPQSIEEVNEELEKIAVDKLKDLEDAFGKAAAKALGLKGVLGELVADLAKLALRYALGALGQSIGIPIGGARAGGGDVDAGKIYRVGERGEEWFLPGVSGTIVPNHVIRAARMPQVPRAFYGPAANDTGRGSGGPRHVTQIWNVSTPDADSFRRNERQMQRDGRRRLGVGK